MLRSAGRTAHVSRSARTQREGNKGGQSHHDAPSLKMKKIGPSQPLTTLSPPSPRPAQLPRSLLHRPAFPPLPERRNGLWRQQAQAREAARRPRRQWRNDNDHARAREGGQEARRPPHPRACRPRLPPCLPCTPVSRLLRRLLQKSERRQRRRARQRQEQAKGRSCLFVAWLLGSRPRLSLALCLWCCCLLGGASAARALHGGGCLVALPLPLPLMACKQPVLLIFRRLLSLRTRSLQCSPDPVPLLYTYTHTHTYSCFFSFSSLSLSLSASNSFSSLQPLLLLT